MSEEYKKSKKKEIEQKALQGAAAEAVSRYGDAAKQHFVSYSGTDNEAGVKLVKGLKGISKSKTNADFHDTNIKQQAGFSAEVKEVARENADRIIRGDKTRVVRSDDLGNINDQYYDHYELDASGRIIDGSGTQMKFVGSDSKQALVKLKSRKYQKYIDKGVPFEVPTDYFNGIIEEANNQISSLRNQVDALIAKGDSALANEKLAEIEKLEVIKNNLRKSKVSTTEAKEAREQPVLSTAKDIKKLAHEAGLAQAKTGAIISGSVSVIRNVVACMKGEIDPQDAAIAVAKDTGVGAAFSYATAFSGTVAKGAMQNASSAYIRSLSKTNLASSLVSTTLNVGKTMTKFIKGEMDGAQCVEALGEQGVGEIGSAMYAAIALTAVQGTSSIAIKIVAGMAGSTLGYTAAVAVYQELATSLKEYKFAVEERKRIEAECEEAVKLICQYRAEMAAAIKQYMTEHLETFDEGFKAMDNAILQNDVNSFISGNAIIQEKLGHEIQFRTQEEFDDFMSSDNTLIL